LICFLKLGKGSTTLFNCFFILLIPGFEIFGEIIQTKQLKDTYFDFGGSNLKKKKTMEGDSWKK
jgi:hypothetical protein